MITRINIGPVHPSTRGGLRIVADIDGDTVADVEPHVGFLHRGVEKLAETRDYLQNLPYLEKLDYVAPMSYGDIYIAAVESALGVLVGERAAYARTILLELQRIASHLLWLGTMANDLGQPSSIFMWAFRDRDKILRLLEETSGARMFYVNMRLGGLVKDFHPDFAERTEEVLGLLEKRIRDYDSFATKNPVFNERLRGVGTLTREMATELGVTGPVLRGSGVEYDVRKESPYYAYKRLNFRTQSRSEGDCLARYRVRMLEIRESMRLVRDAFRKMPEGSAVGTPIRITLPRPERDVVQVSRETPRGECMVYMVADMQGPYRLSIRSPSFVNLTALREISRGCRVADLFAILGSLDLVMGDVDR
jgi:NADH:ubiquinone oxidoreductase subunit D